MPEPRDEESLADLQKLYPAYQLWTNPEFQKWVSTRQVEMDELQKQLVITANPIPIQSQFLKAVGMDPPHTQEERLRLYLVFSGVVTFWNRTIRRLQSEAEKYEKKVKRE